MNSDQEYTIFRWHWGIMEDLIGVFMIVAPVSPSIAPGNSQVPLAVHSTEWQNAFFANGKEPDMKFTVLSLLASTFIALATPVHAEKTAGNVVDDSTIQASVKAGLLMEEGVPSNDVNVETYKGVVLLSGFVKSQEQKDAAGRVASGVSGVKQVRNQIAIHESTSMGTKVDDTVLVGEVKAALIDSADVKGGQINVEARGGIVQLGGFVTSAAMRDRALAIAKGVKGVKHVDDALFVKPQ